MRSPVSGTMRVEAEVITAMATLRLIWFDHGEAPDTLVSWNNYYLDLSLTPRPANMRACYNDHWTPHHFRPVGDMFLVPPGELLHVRADGPVHHTSIVCEIDAAMLHEWLGFVPEWNDRRLEASLDMNSNSIRHKLRRLAEEARNPGLASARMCDLVAGQLAIEVGRFFEAIVEAPVTGGLAAWRLRLIDDRLKEMRVMPTLGELAELCSISVRQLTRGFRKSRGCTIGDYVAQSRIENAKRLLSDGHSIKSIAHALGYTSTSSFSYAFRRAIAMTPRQFLNRVYRTK
jgi:AraC family transcriptional regulator